VFFHVVVLVLLAKQQQQEIVNLYYDLILLGRLLTLPKDKVELNLIASELKANDLFIANFLKYKILASHNSMKIPKKAKFHISYNIL
jgi:hypothetical protein